MADLTQHRRALIEWIADEFLHNSPRGRRLVAVEGASSGHATRFAVDFAAMLAERGQHVVRIATGDVDEATLRRETIEPFRAGMLPGTTDAAGAGTPADPDAVLVVDGLRLLNDSVLGVWHFSVWTLAGDELPKFGVNVNVDVTDEGAPSRYFYDYCKLPPSFGERSAAANAAG